MNFERWGMLGAIAVLAASAAEAQAPSDTVIDGDTIRYKGAVVHLWGIDAPDKGHVCADGWDAGKAAADHLKSLIGNKPVAWRSRLHRHPAGRLPSARWTARISARPWPRLAWRGPIRSRVRTTRCRTPMP
jgi:endonuclease YncB( thermonuclease family)